MQITRMIRWCRTAALLIVIFNLIAVGQLDDPAVQAAKLHAEAVELLKGTSAGPRKEAVKNLEEADGLWRKAGDLRRRAEGLKLLVEALGSLSEAKRGLEYALAALPVAAAIGDKTLEGEMMSNVGGFYDQLGETRKGIPYVEAAIEHFRSVGDASREATALNTAGVLYSEIGEMQTALELLNRALAMRRELSDGPAQARTLINIGGIYEDIGQLRRSAETYQQGIELIPAGDLRTKAIALNNMGIVLNKLGDYQRAIDTYDKALALRRESGDKRGESITYANQASVYRVLGEFERALDLLNLSLAIHQAGGFKRNEAITLSSIGAVRGLMGDDNKALEYYQKALDIDRSIGNKAGQGQRLRNVAAKVADLGQPEEALKLVEEGLRLATEASDKEEIADLTLLKARTFEQLGQLDKASEKYSEAIELARQMEIPFDLAEALYRAARLDRRRNAAEAASQKMAEVMSIVENLRNSLVGQDLRSSYFADQQPYFDFYISLLAERHLKEPDKGYGAEAFRVSERARARSLLESLGHSRKEIRSGVSAALVDRESRLRFSISTKESQRQTAVSKRDRPTATRLENELTVLVNEFRNLQAEMRKQNPRIAELVGAEPLDLRALQSSVLDDESILLEYFLGKERSWLFAVTRTGLGVIELPSEERIETLARSALAKIRSLASEERLTRKAQRDNSIPSGVMTLDRDLADLHRALIEPVAARLRNKRLLIVAPGVLQYFPFAALRSGSGEGRPRYLIELNEIVMLPSASVVPLLRQNRDDRGAQRNTVAVVADPVFSDDDSRLRMTRFQDATENSNVMRDVRYLSPILRSGLARLRFSRNEADAIADLVPDSRSTIALDFAANLPNATSEDVRRARIVHFATHGVVDSRLPELSGLVFSLYDPRGKPQNGYLRLADIYNLDLSADLVVLSACETALGKEIKGEGLVGLTRGMMFAGASSVAASLWRVEDRATAGLMKHFYKGILKESLSPAAALRTAQMAAMREKGRSHPFYWAGFTLQGDWKPAK